MTKSNLYPHEFWLKVGQYLISHPSQRYGQATYNCLCQYKPDHAQYIAGTMLDPFNDDGVIPHLHEWLAQHWLDEFE